MPSCGGEIAYEHWHRYAFARRFAAGKRVLDAACGEGYGTALLGAVAASVVGIDIDIKTIDHARTTYGESNRLRFFAASCADMPVPSASFDVVVSFETIEHLQAAQQPEMLSEFARVLARDGVLVISSPNKRLYSDARDYVNPFHVQELYRDDLARLLGAFFPAQRWYHQRLAFWSGIWAERMEQGALRRAGQEAVPDTEGANEAALAETWVGDTERIAPYAAPEGMYFIVVAARNAAALPAAGAGISLFTDSDESELKRAAANAREVLRLDGLLKENDAALVRQAGHVEHLETLVAERERLVVERDAAVTRHAAHVKHLETLVVERDRQLAETSAARDERDKNIAALGKQLASLEIGRTRLESERTRLEAALAAQERVIAFLQSFRGWIGWPWRRMRRWLGRAR
ncbi:MAG: methyltransferase domain-containing protein [Pseudomonadota bacterium]|nr:methyltransferase domain-containing protein [Pseudomonadota bacterium]